MQLTKYEHACFTLAKGNKVVVVDPGAFTSDFIVPEGVVAIIITHEHADHFEPKVLDEIFDKNPSAILLADASIVAKLTDHPNIAVKAGDTLTVEGFTFAFFGGTHATIHSDMPAMANLGILIDDTLYYPGDSFVRPSQRVNVLALPAAAPWMKISEAMDFLREVRPRLVFPTHDAILSDIGQQLTDRMLGATAQDVGAEYRRLGGPIELSSLHQPDNS